MSEDAKVEPKTTTIYSQLELPLGGEKNASADPEVCPECGVEGTIMRTGHCASCLFCGWSMCSV
jgi:hypothetical protein